MQVRNETISELAAVDVVRISQTGDDGSIAEYSTLSPTDVQRSNAEKRSASFVTIAKIIIAFLRRHNPPAADVFSDDATEFLSFVQWARVNANPNMPEDTWRAIFVRQVDDLIDKFLGLIRDSADAFSALRSRSLPLYEELSLQLYKDGNSGYRVDAKSPSGEDTASVVPLSLVEIRKFLSKYTGVNSPNMSIARRMDPIIEFGHSLFRSLFREGVLDLYFRSIEFARSQSRGLRIVLDLVNAPGLVPYPWELLYDGSDFIALSPSSPIVRRVQSRLPSEDAVDVGNVPIRLIVSVSSPSDMQPIDIANEKQRLLDALSLLISLGILTVKFTPDGKARSLQRMLRLADLAGQPYHIWHHIGHGYYSEDETASVLYFEDEDGQSVSLGGFELSTLFSGHPSLRLALLNTCDAGRSGGRDSTSGVATGLAKRGFSCVVAMQFPISDDSALNFAEEFYAALADGLPVEIAVTEGRRAVFLIPSPCEWAAAVIVGNTDSGTAYSLKSAMNSVALVSGSP